MKRLATGFSCNDRYASHADRRHEGPQLLHLSPESGHLSFHLAHDRTDQLQEFEGLERRDGCIHQAQVQQALNEFNLREFFRAIHLQVASESKGTQGFFNLDALCPLYMKATSDPWTKSKPWSNSFYAMPPRGIQVIKDVGHASANACIGA